ncbi:MAG: hypothetical protein U0Y68_27400 [Blastocatellia bacterium]
MNTTTFIKKYSLLFFAVVVMAGCDNAPPPKASSEVVPASAANTVSSKRIAKSKTPGAVLQNRSLQAVNEVEAEQTDGKKFKFASLKGKVILVDVYDVVRAMPRTNAATGCVAAKISGSWFGRCRLESDEKSDQKLVLDFMKQAANYPIVYAGEKLSGPFLDGTEDETGAAPIPQLFVISKRWPRRGASGWQRSAS